MPPTTHSPKRKSVKGDLKRWLDDGKQGFDKDGYQTGLKDLNGEKLPTKASLRNARSFNIKPTTALRSSIQWRRAAKGSMPTKKDYTIFIAKVNAANEVVEVDCAFSTYYQHSPYGTKHFPFWMPASEGLKLFPKP